MAFLVDKIIIFQILFVIGITAESMSGTISAGRKNMDLFGIITIATITALGGGTVRDILLGYYPLTWILYPEYIVVTFFASVVAIFVAKHIIRLHKFFLIADALGLVTFAYLGSDIGYKIALHAVNNDGFTVIGSFIIAIIMAIITGISGGVLRDILCNDVPLVFQAELYAIVAAVVGFLHTITLYFQIDNLISALTIIGIGFCLRLCAIYKNWHLPRIKYFS
ncbi:trimeric intracellular cation channel family protein [Fastidiosibacter lacustris]|uniref:trimeric intracellular cation channel family protein n=1 Tax=Fastidiosibacter lacustris TaxID=2056695 RepID=UPI000E34B18B|nr:trimeric intracellular cation channel family protein [Fastidiosibacter lacustris]